MASIHHYVPRFLLRHFCSGERPRLWAYDKRTGKSFQTNVQNIAGERTFYETRIGDETVSFEDGLSELESEAAVLIGRIISERSIGWLSDENRALLATFVAVQMNRGAHTRESFIAMDKGLRRVFGERFGLPTEGHPLMTSERAKQAALTSLAESDRYAEHILNKTWLLFETSAETPMYFMQLAGEPLKLRYKKEIYGPYAENLRHLLHAVEGYFISGYSDGGDEPDKPLELVPGRRRGCRCGSRKLRRYPRALRQSGRSHRGFRIGLRSGITLHGSLGC